MAKAVLVIGSASMVAALVSHLIGRLIGLIPFSGVGHLGYRG